MVVFLLLISVWACRNSADFRRVEERLLVVHKSENNGYVLNAVSGERLAIVITGVGPHEVAAHTEKSLAVVANYGNRTNPGSSLTVVDLSQMRAVKTIGLGKYRRPHGIQFFRDGRRVAVTVEEDRALLVIDIDTGKIEKVIPTNQRGSHLVVLSPDQSRAFVTNIEDGSLSVLDIPRSRLLRILKLGEGPEGMAISPDGQELWVADRARDVISIIDTGEMSVLETLPCPSFPIRVQFTPDGGRVLVSNARSGDVAVFSVAERREIARIKMELTHEEKTDRLLHFELSPVPIGITVHPYGNRAFVANANADIVSVLNLEDGTISGRFQVGKEPDGMALVSVEVSQ